MKKFIRVAGIFLLLVLTAVALVVAFRDRLLKTVATRAIREASGLDLSIGSIRSSLRPAAVQIRALEIQNPPGFGPDEAFRMDELYVSVDPASLFRDEIRIPEMRLRMRRIVVVRDKTGNTNLEQLGREIQRTRRTDRSPARPPDSADPVPETASRPQPPATVPDSTRSDSTPEKSFHIDRLEVYIGDVEIHEHRAGETEPRVQCIRLDRNVVFEEVTDFTPVLKTLALQWTVAALPTLIERAREAGNTENALRELRKWLR